MKRDDLGDRMKFYESRFASVFTPFSPVISRLDGRSFHTFTKNLEKPYDINFSKLMIETTKYLVSETNARCGYVQSDEISLVWLAEEWESELFFAGKIQKMNSILASMCSSYFNRKLSDYLPEKNELIKFGKIAIPVFDNRVFQVPVNYEASNYFIWRESDATRNSIQMAARAYFSHNQCFDKNTLDLNEMLFSLGINWNDYPSFFKRGTYIRRRMVNKVFSPEELENLPPKHEARLNPLLVVKRTEMKEENFPPLTKIKNKEDVILFGQEPILFD